MAGTGHGYEIANIADVRAAIAALVETAQADAAAVAWLSGRSFLRYATSEPFVFKARKSMYLPCLEGVSESERVFIERKLENGGDVRLFSATEFRRAGPDVPHILDWMAHVRDTRPHDHAKIPRMAAEDLVRKVASWIKPKSRGTALPEGDIRHLLETTDGYSWVELLDRAALQAEGDAMSHCVDRAGYALELEHGRLRILSMRSAEGRRLLTMELRGDGGASSPVWVRQIQAFGNQPPPEGAVASICEILNHLAVVPTSSDQERRAKIANVDGVWQSIYMTWKKIELGGLDCITDGSELVFMSPVHPDRPLVNVTSLLPSAFRILGDQISVPEAAGLYQVCLADERHFTIDELRAAAQVADTFHARIDHVLFEANGEGGCVPYVDTLIEQEADGCSFLSDPATGNAYVTHPQDKALVLLEIGRRPRLHTSPKAISYGANPAWAHNIARWKEEDLQRCLSAMTAMGSAAFGTSPDELRPVTRRFEPMRTKSGQWRSFLIDARRHDTKNPAVHWLETPYMLALVKDGRRQICFDIHDGELHSLPYTWPSGLECSEIALRLNALKIKVADSIWCGSLGERLEEKRRPNLGHIVSIRGRWKVVRSQRDMVKLFEDIEGLSPGECRLVLHALPEYPAMRIRETDTLYARSMARGAFAVHEDDVRMPYDSERARLLWLYDNLALLDPKGHKAAIRHATRLLDRWAKMPQSLMGKMDDHIHLFFCVKSHLKPALVGRIVSHVFRKNRYWLGSSASDLAWVTEVYPSLTNEKFRANLYRGIERGACAYSTVSDPDVLRVNAACLQVYARHDSILLDFKIERIEAAYRELIATELTQDKQEVMIEVREMIDRIPSIILERETEIANRWRRLDEMFSRNKAEPFPAVA